MAMIIPRAPAGGLPTCRAAARIGSWSARISTAIRMAKARWITPAASRSRLGLHACSRRTYPNVRAACAYACSARRNGASSDRSSGSNEWTRPRGRSMVINLNLDSVGGASALPAVTSGSERLDAWIKDTAARAGLPIATHVPLMANSDHANFAAHGIPAVRLLAGFNAPDSNLRLVLTAADTRDKVQPWELDQALRIATTLTWQALATA